MLKVTQWSIREFGFSASEPVDRPFSELDRVRLRLKLSHCDSDLALSLEGFWNGGATWCVRFALPKPGRWTWRTDSPDPGLDAHHGHLECVAPTSSQVVQNPNLRGHLQIDDWGRYFEYADGTPFFFLGDTNWSMNTLRCGLGNAGDGPFFRWIDHRKRLGFTAVFVQCFSIVQANEGGHPFPSLGDSPGNRNYQELNSLYFQALDERFDALWTAGLVMAVHPTWIGKEFGLSPDDACHISRYLLARYGAYNLIWSLSGEYQYAYTNPSHPWTTADWHRLGKAVQSWNPYHHPVSIHPSGKQVVKEHPKPHPQDNDEAVGWVPKHDIYAPPDWPPAARQASSSGEFHEADWLDHNWLQTGQSEDRLWRVTTRTAENRSLKPAKPVLHTEGWYENIVPSGATPAQIRWQAWVSYLSGAAGHGYGASGVYQFYDPAADNREGQARFNTPPPAGEAWRQALEYPGASQLTHLHAFFTSIPWWTLEPHREWLRIDGNDLDIHSVEDPHCAATPGERCVVYLPAGNAGAVVEVFELAGPTWTARWFNPRTGHSSQACPNFTAAPNLAWRIPTLPDAQDWVLLLSAVNAPATIQQS